MENIEANLGLEVLIRDPIKIIISYLNKTSIKSLIFTKRKILNKVEKEIKIFKELNEKQINICTSIENIIKVKFENSEDMINSGKQLFMRICNIRQLNQLDLSHNQINKIEALTKCNFTQLNQLYLSHNQINNIEALTKCNFTQLNQLNLSCNK